MAGTARTMPLTARGRATRDRIVEAAARLMYERGVGGTSLDDVRAATATSKSQLYHYFADKSALVCAVVAFQRDAVLAGQQPYLGDMSSLAGLRAWRDHLVAVNGAAAVLGGCPVGGLAGEVSGVDDAAGDLATGALDLWRLQLQRGFQRMQESGELSAEADPARLATGLLAAVQGGLLLAQATQRIAALEIALDHAIAAVEARTHSRPLGDH